MARQSTPNAQAEEVPLRLVWRGRNSYALFEVPCFENLDRAAHDERALRISIVNTGGSSDPNWSPSRYPGWRRGQPLLPEFSAGQAPGTRPPTVTQRGTSPTPTTIGCRSSPPRGRWPPATLRCATGADVPIRGARTCRATLALTTGRRLGGIGQGRIEGRCRRRGRRRLPQRSAPHVEAVGVLSGGGCARGVTNVHRTGGPVRWPRFLRR